LIIFPLSFSKLPLFVFFKCDAYIEPSIENTAPPGRQQIEPDLASVDVDVDVDVDEDVDVDVAWHWHWKWK